MKGLNKLLSKTISDHKWGKMSQKSWLDQAATLRTGDNSIKIEEHLAETADLTRLKDQVQAFSSQFYTRMIAEIVFSMPRRTHIQTLQHVPSLAQIKKALLVSRLPLAKQTADQCSLWATLWCRTRATRWLPPSSKSTMNQSSSYKCKVGLLSLICSTS